MHDLQGRFYQSAKFFCECQYGYPQAPSSNSLASLVEPFFGSMCGYVSLSSPTFESFFHGRGDIFPSPLFLFGDGMTSSVYVCKRLGTTFFLVSKCSHFLLVGFLSLPVDLELKSYLGVVLNFSIWGLLLSLLIVFFLLLVYMSHSMTLIFILELGILRDFYSLG